MPFLEYNGAKLHYVDVDNRDDKSKGIPLIFVHGAGSSHIAWALQLKEFSKTNRTIAIDLSGHGKSDVILGEASIDQGYTCEVDALVRHLELEEFVLVGHSMGGGVAMSYVLNSDTLNPKALVLVDTSPDLNLTKLAKGMVIETLEDRIYLMKSKAFEEFDDSYKIKKYEDEIKALNPGIMQRDLLACDKFDVTERLSEINVPTFVLVGEDDDIISPKSTKTFENLIPRSDIAVVRKADHSPMIEQPDEFNRLLRKFIVWVEKNH